MKQFINTEQLSMLPTGVFNDVIHIAGLGIDYKNDPNTINTFFTIGKILELIDSHAHVEFHINDIVFHTNSVMVSSDKYGAEDKCLIDALWKALVYCYDNSRRKQIIEEREAQWATEEEELVHEK